MTLKLRKWIVPLLVIILVAACSANPTPVAVLSTPVADLPVNASGSAAQAVPTAVSEAVVDAADADYVLLTNIYERTAPSVVNIEAIIGTLQTGISDLSNGSGFIYDSDGHIVTNAHVVKDATAIRVTFNDGYVVDAEVVGVDTYSDLAVIKIETGKERLNPLSIGDSELVKVGQRAIAIGNPFGLASSMSEGIVAGIGRTLRSAELIDIDAVPGFQNPSIIQVDTPINPGNSGGPLLNSSGEVVGVTTAIRTESGVFAGVGFAVPSNTVKRVARELIEKGTVDYAWMGISVMPEEDGFGVAGLSEALDLPVNRGVLIRGIQVGSPADKAGLLPGDIVEVIRDRPVCAGGDIIIAINETYVATMDELVAYLVANSAPGDTVKLLVVRGAETLAIDMTLEARPTENTETRTCGF